MQQQMNGYSMVSFQRVEEAIMTRRLNINLRPQNDKISAVVYNSRLNIALVINLLL